MSRLEQIKDPKDDEVLKRVYAEAAEMGWADEKGNPSNYVTALSTRPDLLKALIDLTNAVLVKGELPLTVKAMVFYTIAERSKCRYCAVANQRALQMMGVPDDVITSCARDPELADVPPSQREIIKFGVKASKYPQSLTDEDFEVLKNQGLSDGEIAELVMMAGYSALLDIGADALGIEVD